jgi:hypothetical protein
VTHPALALCFGEHVHPAADRILPDHALKRDAITSDRSQVTHPALALCFGEHVHPAADRILPDHALKRDAITSNRSEVTHPLWLFMNML